ncbi:ATP-binding protein [Nocardioides daejeonensis]|uniref:ATP-binding protein n=1 Tax=Nocardioides daejeonensis TaxID=1046556 RepID=UPI000D74F6BD|nr:ATP-binding protein [Nocardioides daejeonensis]
MSFETTVINDDSANVLLGEEEGYVLDFKATEIAPSKSARALSAFANSDGGDLYIGISEDKENKVFQWRGFSSIEDANGHIQAFESVFPLGNEVDYEFLSLESNREAGYVLKVSVRRSSGVSYSTDQRAYVRRGAQCIPATGEALTRLEYRKGTRSFETHPVDVPIDFVSNSESIIGFMLEVVPSREPIDFLRKQLLVREGKPTVASLVLFADEPQSALPKQTGLKLYRYTTTEDQGTRASLVGQPQTIEGNAYNLIKDAVRATVEMMEGIRVMGPAGLEKVTYPEVTLHEIITNAVLHRDYSIADDVHVRVFDNRIEVESPGGLPSNITPETILTERFSRNGNIVRWITKFPDPPNKDVGEGLQAAIDAMREMKLRAPEVIDRGTSVLVLIRHQRLASPEELVLEYLQAHDEITNSVVRGLTGNGSENSVKRIFKNMIKNGLIEPVPGRSLRYAAYRLPVGPGQADDGA